MARLVEAKSAAVRLSGSFRIGKRLLFSDLNLTLAGGQWTCLLGASGIGKSTLLKLLAGLPTGGKFEGQIEIDTGAPIAGSIAYMAQSDLLFPWLTVRSNVLLGEKLRGENKGGDRADALIRRVGLEAYISKHPNQLSGGMRQRVALARTLMEDTPIVLLDEPFSALDTRTRREMQDLAFDLLRHKTVLLVTHDPAEALRLSEQLVVMSSYGLDTHVINAGEPLRAADSECFIASQSRLLHILNREELPDA